MCACPIFANFGCQQKTAKDLRRGPLAHADPSCRLKQVNFHTTIHIQIRRIVCSNLNERIGFFGNLPIKWIFIGKHINCLNKKDSISMPEKRTLLIPGIKCPGVIPLRIKVYI
jgi:hypothetical protein